MSSPAVFDRLLFAGFAFAYPLYGYLTWPRFLAEARGGRAGARARTYGETVLVEWALALALLVWWGASGRSWPLLGLGAPLEGRGPLALVGVGVVGLLALVHARSVARAPAAELAAAHDQLGELVHFMPHTPVERWLFASVAVTAGACEELFFRGLAPWLLSSWMPTWAAIVAATLLFGLAHAYQGLAGVLKSAVVGAVMAAVTLAAGTLWPAIVLHAIVDLHGGSVGGSIARARAGAS